MGSDVLEETAPDSGKVVFYSDGTVDVESDEMENDWLRRENEKNGINIVDEVGYSIGPPGFILREFLEDGNYGFTIDDINPHSPGLFQRLKDKDLGVYFDFQEYQHKLAAKEVKRIVASTTHV